MNRKYEKITPRGSYKGENGTSTMKKAFSFLFLRVELETVKKII
jgi:hypothetical protein